MAEDMAEDMVEGMLEATTRCRFFGIVAPVALQLPFTVGDLSMLKILPQTAVTMLMSAFLLSGCATDQYVKRTEFDSTVAGLRDTDANLQAELSGFKSQFSELTRDLNERFTGYDATIGGLQGRLRVDMTAHFAYDDATLRDEDKPALDEFSAVARDYTPHIVVTVEGFTDPAGDPEYNQWLGQKRAEAVRTYLIEQGGLDAGAVKAVSYGEDSRRMLAPGAWGDSGAQNRRVSLVVDYVGPRPTAVGANGSR